MKAHEDEHAEREALQIHGELVKMAVKHIRAADARFDSDTADGREAGAFGESDLILRWTDRYRDLIS